MIERSEQKPIKVAAAQFCAVGADIESNIDSHVRLIEDAGRLGVDLVVFPELSLTGYTSETLDSDPERCVIAPQGSVLSPLLDACRRCAVVAIVGASLRGRQGLELASLVIDRQGRVAATYGKQHLDGHEKNWFVAGQESRLITFDGWSLGLGICYDSSFPEHCRSLALEGADLYLVSGAFPVGASDHRRSVYIPARALENTVFVAFSNYIGAHDGLTYCGHSAIAGPDGQLLADAGPDQPGLAVAVLDPGLLREARRSLQMLNDRRSSYPPAHAISLDNSHATSLDNF